MNKLIPVLLTMLPLTLFADLENLPDLENITRLRTGDVLHEFINKDDAGASIRVEILVRAAVEDIWGTVESCEKAYIFVEGLTECEVLEETEEYALVHKKVEKGFAFSVQDNTLETKRQPYTRIERNLVKGNLKALQLSWDFIAVDEGVVVIYNLHVEPGVPAPGFIVRNSLGNTIPDMLACIRGMVDGSGNPEQNKKDLDSCPGDAS